MPKRAAKKRPLSDILTAVDDLITKRPIYQPDIYPDSQEARSSTPEEHSPGPTAIVRESVASPASSSLYDSLPTSESLGGTELDLLRRKDEELADMIVFFIEAFERRPSEHNFCEMLNLFLDGEGPQCLLQAMRHGGVEEKCLSILFRVSLASNCGKQKAHYFSFLLWIVQHCDRELFCRRPMIEYLIKALQSSPEPTTGTAASPPPRTRLHWSDSGKKAQPASPSSEEDNTAWDKASTLLKALWGNSEGETVCSAITTTASLSLRILLELVFSQNQRGLEIPLVESVPVLFVTLGGLRLLLGELKQRHCNLGDALQFLEVVTVSPKLSDAIELQYAAEVLTELLAEGPGPHSASLLRVLTNITGLRPCSLVEDSVSRLAAYCRQLLLDDLCDTELLTFAICCSVNMLREPKRSADYCRALTSSSSPSFCDTMASCMSKRYQAGETESTVLSGYYALLLAVLSFVSVVDDGGEHTALRVPVITAVMKATKETQVGVKCERKPMTIIVAIIQEFLFFQSASGTLTKEMAVAFNTILDRLLQDNDIEIEAS